VRPVPWIVKRIGRNGPAIGQRPDDTIILYTRPRLPMDATGIDDYVDGTAIKNTVISMDDIGVDD
jgi:hypothetical protein